MSDASMPHSFRPEVSGQLTDARCELTDLLVSACAHCTGRDGGEGAEREARARALTMPGVVAAKFEGQCADCGTWYAAGEPIRHADGYGWIAACCIFGEPHA